MPPQYPAGPMPPPGYPPYPPPGYYPPPQKSGVPVWVIFVIVGVIVVPFILGVLALAAIPLIASNTQEARSSEARAALGAMKDRARIVYQRNSSSTLDMMALNISSAELNGTYFTAADYSVTSSNPLAWSAQCNRVFERPPRELAVTLNLIKGDATFNR